MITLTLPTWFVALVAIAVVLQILRCVINIVEWWADNHRPRPRHMSLREAFDNEYENIPTQFKPLFDDKEPKR